MNGKQYFKNYCKDAGLNYNELFQLGNNNAKPADRLRHHFSKHNRTKSQLYVVCYFQRYNIYVAWSLREQKAFEKTDFSIKKTDVEFDNINSIISVNKAIEFYGWGEETVLAFKPEAIPEFFNRYCIPKMK